MKSYIGGHTVEVNADSGTVLVDGSAVSVSDSSEYFHVENDVEIFK